MHEEEEEDYIQDKEDEEKINGAANQLQDLEEEEEGDDEKNEHENEEMYIQNYMKMNPSAKRKDGMDIAAVIYIVIHCMDQTMERSGQFSIKQKRTKLLISVHLKHSS